MKTSAAVEYFGTRYKIAKALNVKHQYVYAWGLVVPPNSAVKLQELSGGKIRIDRSLYKLGAAK